jgi:hypothetical protein
MRRIGSLVMKKSLVIAFLALTVSAPWSLAIERWQPGYKRTQTRLPREFSVEAAERRGVERLDAVPRKRVPLKVARLRAARHR